MAVMETNLPTRKLWSGGLAGIAALGIVWASRRYLQFDIDPVVAGAFVLSAAKAVAYLVPPAARDRIIALDAELKAP